MRLGPLLLILVLVLAAGGLLVLVLGQDPAGSGREDLGGMPGAGPGEGTGGERLSMDLQIVEVVPEGQWNLVLERDEHAFLERHPAFARHRRMEHPSGRDWTPTGAEVLDTIARATGGGVTLRFKDEQALQDFKQGRWPIPLPPLYRLHMLLDTAVEIGFRPIVRGDAIYVIRVEEDGA